MRRRIYIAVIGIIMVFLMSASVSAASYTKYNGVDLSEIYDFDYYVTHNRYAKKHFAKDPKGAILYFGRYAIRKGVKAKADYSKKTYKKLYKKTHPFPKADRILDKLDWNLRKAFERSASNQMYHGADLGENNKPYKRTTKWYFDYLMKNGRGNCFCESGMFVILATEMGYSCRQICGVVPLRSGGSGTHAWMEIKYKGKTRVCDPSFFRQFGSGGWMVKYGSPGTYQYSSPRKMKLK